MEINLLEKYANIGKALANKNRVEIISILLQTKKTVEQLAHDTQLSIANVSKHLQVLLKSRVVTNEKYKNYVYYQIANIEMHDFLSHFLQIGLHQYGEEQLLTQNFLNANDEPVAITLEEMEQKLQANEIKLLDVRPSEEFNQKHIPGAISMPVVELEKYINALPKDTLIVAYCRGIHCLLSKEAITLLEKNGYKAIRLTHDVNEWETLATSN